MSLIKEQALAQVALGVADLAPVRALWVGHFGLEVVAERAGPDAGLARLWGVEPERIAGQLLLRTPAATRGWLHFVQFNDPAPPVRAGAAPHDLCPKNIDVNCVDMEVRYAELAAAGVTFRSAISAYEIGDIVAREVQAPIHDDINLVLIEVDNWPIDLSPRNYGAVTSFVLAVPDIERESAFYREVLGLELLLEHRVAGEAIEKVVGLPPGAALLLRLLGGADQLYGRVELIEYEGMHGADRYPAARAPALGSLVGRFETDDLDALCARLKASGMPVRDCGTIELISGPARVAATDSPAGFGLELMEPL